MIDYAWNNQIEFFFILLAQYILLATQQERLKKAKIAKPLFIWFILQDWLMNMFMTFWFLDLPRTLNEVVTDRMKRYKREYKNFHFGILESWRYLFAIELCKILNKFDKNHC